MQKQVRNKTRKSLQTLQLNSEEVRKNMICTNEKVRLEKYKIISNTFPVLSNVNLNIVRFL